MGCHPISILFIIQNSPYHPFDYSSWYITSRGVVNYNNEINYSYSYGMSFYIKKKSTFRSPSVFNDLNDHDACQVYSDGDVGNRMYIDHSYGHNKLF